MDLTVDQTPQPKAMQAPLDGSTRPHLLSPLGHSSSSSPRNRRSPRHINDRSNGRLGDDSSLASPLTSHVLEELADLERSMLTSSVLALDAPRPQASMTLDAIATPGCSPRADLDPSLHRDGGAGGPTSLILSMRQVANLGIELERMMAATADAQNALTQGVSQMAALNEASAWERATIAQLGDDIRHARATSRQVKADATNLLMLHCSRLHGRIREVTQEIQALKEATATTEISIGSIQADCARVEERISLLSATTMLRLPTLPPCKKDDEASLKEEIVVAGRLTLPPLASIVGGRSISSKRAADNNNSTVMATTTLLTGSDALFNVWTELPQPF